MSEEILIFGYCVLSFILGFLICDKIHNILASRKKKGEA